MDQTMQWITLDTLVCAKVHKVFGRVVPSLSTGSSDRSHQINIPVKNLCESGNLCTRNYFGGFIDDGLEFIQTDADLFSQAAGAGSNSTYTAEIALTVGF